ncbi:MAG: hypothetical protein JWO20_3173 [Candidatus Angelobacter sp.]|nr:hypothetical protein [Candidatus Angelobacter sp.]
MARTSRVESAVRLTDLVRVATGHCYTRGIDGEFAQLGQRLKYIICCVNAVQIDFS